MANIILTPVTLWKDFDDSLPLQDQILSERREGRAVCRDVTFYGRDTEMGRVKIYARYVTPAGLKKFPAVMVLFEAGLPFDETFIMRFVAAGYAVLAVDYCGERPESLYTVYPKRIDYANFVRAGRHLDYCDDTARETAWYEWAAVARYAVKYLRAKEEVTAVGAIGLRTGGEVLFKIAPYAALDCMISVCAAGWLAYRGIVKFGAEHQPVFDEERHRFIAGIDSQSYAPHVNCPVLLLSAINDKSYNYDRVYDTFSQFDPSIEKALLYSAHGNGLLGSHSLKDIDLFLAKHLKKQAIFISKPIELGVEEDRAGNLVVRGRFDPAGRVKEFGIFYTENVGAFKARDWTRVLGSLKNLDGSTGTVSLPLYSGSNDALVYAFVNYANNFSVTSKIAEIHVTKEYVNSQRRSRILYTEEDGRNGFTTFRRRTRAVADCFAEDPDASKNLPGFGGIKGIAVGAGIVSYRVGEPRFRPPEGVSFRFDAWSQVNTRLKIVFYKDEEEVAGFGCEVPIAGGGKWKGILLDPSDFKSETGISLGTFDGVVSVVFLSEDETLINNVIWI